MLKEQFEKIGEIVNKLIENDEVTIQMTEDEFNYQGYADATVTFEDMIVRCSINQKGYICWLDYGWLKRIISPINEKRLCENGLRQFYQNEKEKLEYEIRKKLERLDELKMKGGAE